VTPDSYRLSQDANEDLIERAHYLLLNSSERVMLRFVRAAFATAKSLAVTPGIGQQCGFAKSHLRGLRQFPVKKFSDWLILYREMDFGIEVIRIVHAKQDWRRLIH